MSSFCSSNNQKSAVCEGTFGSRRSFPFFFLMYASLPENLRSSLIQIVNFQRQISEKEIDNSFYFNRSN